MPAREVAEFTDDRAAADSHSSSTATATGSDPDSSPVSSASTPNEDAGLAATAAAAVEQPRPARPPSPTTPQAPAIAPPSPDPGDPQSIGPPLQKQAAAATAQVAPQRPGPPFHSTAASASTPTLAPAAAMAAEATEAAPRWGLPPILPRPPLIVPPLGAMMSGSLGSPAGGSSADSPVARPAQQQDSRDLALDLPQFTQILHGTLVSSCYILRDHNSRKGMFFVFPELCVAEEGEFALYFAVFDTSNGSNAGSILSVASERFRVYGPSASYPGPVEPSEIVRCFARQGMRFAMRVRAEDPG
ncbi:hypothetical protein HK405_008858 [Cladochytrium tenue]|nr:hypothetical protein HK405_008858 [Cladochytrium tenue]